MTSGCNIKEIRISEFMICVQKLIEYRKICVITFLEMPKMNMIESEIINRKVSYSSLTKF